MKGFYRFQIKLAQFMWGVNEESQAFLPQPP